jgi:HSP20 family protein
MLANYNKCYVPTYRDDFFNDFVSSRFYGSGYASTPAVNIIEENDEFRIDVAAAGLSKNDFKIDLDADVLTISTEKKEDKKEAKDNYTRREFNFTSFSRSFKLNDTIDQEQIKAEQVDGILTIHLAKKEESVKPGPKSIDIS